MIIIMLGAPGAGKGTIGKKLSENLGIKHLSSGDIYRSLVKEKTEVGKQIEECINNGKLIPDKLAMEIFENKLVEFDLKKGIILDGYPRTQAQAKHLDTLLASINLKTDVAINIDVPEKLIIDRIVNRRICPQCGAIYNLKYGKKPEVDEICDKCGTQIIQRADDNKKTVCDRLNTYALSTRPLLNYYSDKGVLFNLHSNENTSIDEATRVAMVYVEDM